MIHGDINVALRFLSKSENSGVLPLTDETTEVLQLKHPEASPLHDDLLLEGPVKCLKPVIYNNLDEDTILKAALRNNGLA